MTITFVIGLAHMIYMERDPLSSILFLDQAAYNRRAMEILNGKFLPDTVFFQAPLYPYILASIYHFAGKNNLMTVRFVQLLFGSLSPLLIYLYTRKLFSWNESILAVFLTIFSGILIFYQPLILKVTMSFFVTLLLFHLLTPETALTCRRTLAGGIISGISCLFRGNMLLFIPVVAIYILIRSDKHRIVNFILFCVGVAMCILPVTTINYFHGNDFVLLTAHGGPNLFIGFNPYADGKSGRPPYLRANPEFEENDFRNYAEKETGRTLKPSEVSAFWKQKAVDYIKTHPGESIILLWQKFLIFFNAYEVPDNKNMYFDRRFSPILYIAFIHFGIIAPLAIVGFFISLPRIRQTFLLHSFMVVYAASIIMFHVYSRYRIPILAAMIPFAAHAVIWFMGKVRTRHWRPLVSGFILLILLTIFVNQNLGEYSFAQWHFNLAKGYSATGQPYKAVEELEAALGISPEYAEAWNTLGAIHMAQGDAIQARTEFERALMINPGLAEAHLNLGTCYTYKGEYKNAETQFLAAIENNPQYEKAYFNLGLIYMIGENYGKAAEVFEQAVSLNSGSYKNYYNLAEAYEHIDKDMAVSYFEKSLSLLPPGNKAESTRRMISQRIQNLRMLINSKNP